MSEVLLKNLIIAHMMRDVSARYALLLKVGVSFETAGRLNLNNTPDLVADSLLRRDGGIEYWEGAEKAKEIFANLTKTPLPEGIALPSV